jgi:hypothetical protein
MSKPSKIKQKRKNRQTKSVFLREIENGWWHFAL